MSKKERDKTKQWQLTFDEDIAVVEEDNILNELKILSLPPLLTILTLPYKEPKDEDKNIASFYEKRVAKNNTTYNLSIKSGYDHKKKGNPIYGIPYGIYPRLLLYYICSVVNTTKQKEIYLGSSYKEIFENIQLSDNGNNLSGIQINRFKNQLNRLLNAQIIASKHTKREKEKREENEINYLNIINHVKQVKFWNNEKNKEDEGYIVKLTEDFYKLITTQGSTIFDYSLVKLLKNSPMALDLALYLNYMAYSCYKFNKDLHISYKTLYQQFGSNSTEFKFNQNIKKAIKQVCTTLPNIYIKLDIVRKKEKGLSLLDISRPSIGIKIAENLIIQEEQNLIKLKKSKIQKEYEN